MFRGKLERRKYSLCMLTTVTKNKLESLPDHKSGFDLTVSLLTTLANNDPYGDFTWLKPHSAISDTFSSL